MACRSLLSERSQHTPARSTRPVAIASFVAASAVLALTGCAPADPDPAAITAWMTEASERDETGDLAVMTGQVDRDSVFVGGENIRVDFESPVEVTGVELSCFGEASMRFSVSAGGGDSASGRETDALACADSPHVLSADEVLAGTTGITYIAVDAAESDRRSAWAVVVRGSESDEPEG